MLSTSHKRVLGCGLVVGPEDGGLDLTKAGVCQANTVKRGKVEGFGGTGKGSDGLWGGSIRYLLTFSFTPCFLKDGSYS